MARVTVIALTGLLIVDLIVTDTFQNLTGQAACLACPTGEWGTIKLHGTCHLGPVIPVALVFQGVGLARHIPKQLSTVLYVPTTRLTHADTCTTHGLCPGTSQSGTGQAFCTCDAGVAPTACAVATDTLFNGRCYKACLANYTASGASCVQTCPTGYTDGGGKCTLVDVVVSVAILDPLCGCALRSTRGDGLVQRPPMTEATRTKLGQILQRRLLWRAGRPVALCTFRAICSCAPCACETVCHRTRSCTTEGSVLQQRATLAR